MKSFQVVALSVFLASCTSFDDSSRGVRGPYTVIGEGESEAQAREDGFRQAVGLAMGTAVRSERVVKDNEVALNYVLSHSSGYVERSIINSVEKTGGRFRIGMDVFIKPTIVDDYVLYSAKSTQSIDGKNLSFSIKSRVEEFNSGDEFLNSILNDYPYKAVEIKQGKFSVVTGENRKQNIEVNFSYRFSPKYLASLSQAIRQVNRKNGAFGSPSMQIIYDQLVYFEHHPFGDYHRFHDSVRFSLVKNKLLEPYHFQVTFKNDMDEVLSKTCLKTRYRLSESRKNSHWQGAWHQQCSECVIDDIWIDERWHISLTTLQGNATSLSRNIQELSKLSIEISTPEQCR